MFEKASRLKLRFPSARGSVTVEQLWDVPLQSSNDFNLDLIAKAINADLKREGEESFVVTKTNAVAEDLQLKLDIVKHVIAVKLAEQSSRENEARKRAERQRILEVLDRKRDAELENSDVATLEARLKELGG